jgi:hypothetical protein
MKTACYKVYMIGINRAILGGIEKEEGLVGVGACNGKYG